jgi:acyl dehydratase
VAKAIPSVEGTKLGVNYGLNKVRFIAPVPVGKQIRASVKLAKIDKIEAKNGQGAGIQNIYHITVEVEGSKKPALTAEWISNIYF